PPLPGQVRRLQGQPEVTSHLGGACLERREQAAQQAGQRQPLVTGQRGQQPALVGQVHRRHPAEQGQAGGGELPQRPAHAGTAGGSRSRRTDTVPEVRPSASIRRACSIWYGVPPRRSVTITRKSAAVRPNWANTVASSASR